MHLISTLHDFYGWAAALLTLLAFSCNNIVRLRYVALTANAAFMQCFQNRFRFRAFRFNVFQITRLSVFYTIY